MKYQCHTLNVQSHFLDKMGILPIWISKTDVQYFSNIFPTKHSYQWTPAKLVGGSNSSEKYESQLGWLFPIYGKIKFMATKHNQTTNQKKILLKKHSESHGTSTLVGHQPPISILLISSDMTWCEMMSLKISRGRVATHHWKHKQTC